MLLHERIKTIDIDSILVQLCIHFKLLTVLCRAESMLHYLLSQMLSERLSQQTRIAALYAIQGVLYRHQPAQSALVRILMPSTRMQILYFTVLYSYSSIPNGWSVCKAHLGTCLGEKNWGALFEAQQKVKYNVFNIMSTPPPD